MKVRILSQAAVEAGAAEGADGLISIRASAPEPCEVLDLAVQQAVSGIVDAALVLRFDDVAIPAYGPYVGPTMVDVSTALDFARRIRGRAPEGTLAVHCLHGRSRSAAIALAILADEVGPGQEETAVAVLLRQDGDGKMHPNPAIMQMAEVVLLRGGRLEEALAAACPRYVKWRDYWRAVALDPNLYWDQARRVRFRRRERGLDEVRQATTDAADERLAASLRQTQGYYDLFADVDPAADVTLGDGRGKGGG